MAENLKTDTEKKRSPYKYTPEKIENIIEMLNQYIEETEIPIVAEFAYLNNIPRQRLYDLKDNTLKRLMKKLIDKKEAELERLMLSGKQNVATGCIFSLKQLGWKDRQEITGDKNAPVAVTFITQTGLPKTQENGD